MLKQHRILLGAIALALMTLSGCAAWNAPKPEPGEPIVDQRVQIIVGVSSAFELACLGSKQLVKSPDDLEKAQKAAAAGTGRFWG